MFKVKGIETYNGGKGGAGTYQNIINEIRPHRNLVIPFLGHCAITRNIKRAAGITVGVDASREIVEKWEAMNFSWIHLHHGCGMNYLEKISKQNLDNTVIYLDPPYPDMSRMDPKRRLYEHEMSIEDHERLLNIILEIKCDVLISTYGNDLYSEKLKNWRLKTFNSMTRGGLATEFLYMNYKNPDCVLHDYKYIGNDFRERERIRKKVNRWAKGLQRLPGYERNAILNALDPVSSNVSIDAGSHRQI